MEASILSLSRISKHTFNGNIPVASRCVTLFCHTIDAFVDVLTVTLFQFFSHTKEFLIM